MHRCVRVLMALSEEGPMYQSIVKKLTESLKPVRLEIQDNSARHAGHVEHLGSAAGKGETHFSVFIVSAEFAGKTALQRHRLVNTILADELAGGVHALEVKTKTPEEVQGK
eukprot:RCo038486